MNSVENSVRGSEKMWLCGRCDFDEKICGLGTKGYDGVIIA